MNAETRFRTYLEILGELGSPLRSGQVMLDLGCGGGDLVAAGRQRGYAVFGCDIGFKEGKFTVALEATGAIRRISLVPYRLPFDDASVDCLVSDQVFEHVMDYDSCLCEVHRVLKPGGCTLHIFPSRYMPIEPHVFVPFATLYRPEWWLKFWAAIGFRHPSQRGLPAASVGKRSYQYLAEHTNYLPKREIRDHFAHFFPNVQFAEWAFLKHSRRARILHTLSPVLPFLPAAYSCARSRVVFGNREAPVH
jgi:ubiquinone/menaquinone biosynthesis C-methylase UbiE